MQSYIADVVFYERLKALLEDEDNWALYQYTKLRHNILDLWIEVNDGPPPYILFLGLVSNDHIRICLKDANGNYVAPTFYSIYHRLTKQVFEDITVQVMLGA